MDNNSNKTPEDFADLLFGIYYWDCHCFCKKDKDGHMPCLNCGARHCYDSGPCTCEKIMNSD